MRIVSALLVISCSIGAQDPAAPFDVVIRGGTIINGTGEPAFSSDLGLRDGQIAAIGDLSGEATHSSLDAAGLVVAPGFIDVHTHADNATSRPEAFNFLAMGVTTIITGNCGSSRADLGETFARLEKTGVSVNFASLIGHATVRRAVLGLSKDAPTAAQLEEMQGLVEQAMRAGAVGMSTGLIYVPGTYARTEELTALASIVGEFGGVYATHMRNENDRVLEAIDEALAIGRDAGVPVQISHIKASGKPNWGRSAQIVAKLRDARAAGARVTADQYVYDASSTSLDVLFPSSELTIGRKAFAAKLESDEGFRRSMRAALMTKMKRVGFGDLSYCRIAYAPNNAELNGKTLPQAAAIRYQDDSKEGQARMALDLFAQSKGRRVGMIYHTQSEKDVMTFMREPYVAVACDAGIRLRKSQSLPHPRGAGNNARMLGRFVRELGVVSLPEAIRKMTSLPARTFGLEGRGELRVGAAADVVLFDPETVQDRATYDAPVLTPVGIPRVLVNGVVVVEDGRHTGARPGQVLRHQPDRAGRRGR